MAKHFSSFYWRVRGEKTRILAETMNSERNSEGLKRSLLDIADEYDKLAERTEAQERAEVQEHAAD